MNLPFTKSLNRLEQCMLYHFPVTNDAADDNQLTQFSSAAWFGNEMKLKSRLLPFSFIHILCRYVFCFQFSNRLPSDSMSRPIGSFQIPFLRSFPLSVAWKMSLISLPRYAISVSVWCSDWFGFKWIKIIMIIFLGEKACIPNFIHR